MDLLPGPGRRVCHETLDRERPRRNVQMWSHFRVQHGPLVPCVILARWEARVTSGLASTKESSCRVRHNNSLQTSRCSLQTLAVFRTDSDTTLPSSTMGRPLYTSPTRGEFGRVRPTCPGLPTQAEDWPDGDGAARPLKRLASHWRPADTCCQACRQKLFGPCCTARRPSADSGSIYLSLSLNWTYLVGLIIVVGRPGLDPGTLGLKVPCSSG